MQDQQIIKKLENIENELKDIKEHMIDIDSIMTEDDYKELLKYREDKKTGKLISHKQLKKELGL